MKLSEINSNELNDDLIKKIFFNTKKESYEYADYVIIYGCHIKELLDERLTYALEALKKHDYGKIVLTGGVGINGDFNEAEYMRNFLVSNGIDLGKIIIENKSKTTEENNVNIMNMLNLNGMTNLTNIVLITHEFHLLRIDLHWSKLLDNDNICFYYDYVENSILSYEKTINDASLVQQLKRQVEKTTQFIKDGKYVDKEIF